MRRSLWLGEPPIRQAGKAKAGAHGPGRSCSDPKRGKRPKLETLSCCVDTSRVATMMRVGGAIFNLQAHSAYSQLSSSKLHACQHGKLGSLEEQLGPLEARPNKVTSKACHRVP